jgi:hypothetical protein
VVSGSIGSAAVNAVAGTTTSVSTSTCAANKTLVGGGATVTQGTTARGAVSSSAPTADGKGWTATAVVTISGTGAVTIQSFALCA